MPGSSSGGVTTRNKRGELTAGCDCSNILLPIVNDMRKQLESYMEIILEQNTKIEKLTEEIQTFHTKLEGSQYTATWPELPTVIPTRKKEHVIVVKPREKQDASKVKNDLKTRIDPAGLQVGVNIEKSVREGGVVLKCQNEQALNTIKEDIVNKMGNDYEVKLPVKKNPRVIIVGIEENELTKEKEEFLAKIVKQNKISEDENFKLELIYTTKVRNNTFNAILDVDQRTFRSLIRKDEDNIIHVGWRNCRIYEHMGVRRCFKCAGYNHNSKDCREKVSCVLCAGEHHRSECNSNNVTRCINCLRANEKFKLNLDVDHSAIDRKCKCYIKIIDSMKKKTDYEI